MKALLVAIAIVVLGGGVYLFSNRSDTASSPAETETTGSVSTEQETVPASPETDTAPTQGSYIEFKEGLIASTPGTKILFFHASWCPQCRALDASIKSGEIPAGVTIMKVDYDSNQALRAQYGVTIQTTLVRVDDDGKLVEKFVAYDSPTLKSVEENLL